MAAKITFGNSDITGMFVGSSEVQSVWYGTTKVYEKSGGGGYDLTLNFIARNYRGAGDNSLNFKINGAPSDSDDFEYYMSTPYAGSSGSFTSMLGVTPEVNIDLEYDAGGTYTFNNVSSVTMWIDYDDFDNSDYICINGSSDSDAAHAYPGVTMNLSANTIVNIYYDYDT